MATPAGRGRGIAAKVVGGAKPYHHMAKFVWPNGVDPLLDQ
jgi:hypothetical protein